LSLAGFSLVGLSLAAGLFLAAGLPLVGYTVDFLIAIFRCYGLNFSIISFLYCSVR